MQITLSLPDELAEQLLHQTDPHRFAREAIRTALQKQTTESPEIGQPMSKWAKLAEQIRSNPVSLGDYRERARQDGEEFRESFSFGKEDRP